MGPAARRPSWVRRALIVVSSTVFLSAACGATETVPDRLALTDPESTTTTTSVETTTTTTAPTTTTTIPHDPFRTWIATADDDIPGLVALDSPGGTPLELPFFVPNPHQFGGPLTLMVVDGQPGDEWVQVQLPVKPNGMLGWIDTDDYEISETRVRAEVVLSTTSVRVFDGEELIAETEAVIGSQSTPTPLGTFFVAARKENTEAEYFLGPTALVLSGFSEALETFNGGLPVIAIHGTHRPDQVGQELSNGCIRVPNEVIDFLSEHVPVGAPVHISA